MTRSPKVLAAGKPRHARHIIFAAVKTVAVEFRALRQPLA
jgi:hypothetical protein